MNTFRKIFKKIKDSLYPPITHIFGSSEIEEAFYSPNNSPKRHFNLSPKKTDRHILEDEINDSVVQNSSVVTIDKSEYDYLNEKCEKLEKENSEISQKEQEWRQVVLDYDTTLSFVMESKNENSPLIKKLEDKEKYIKSLKAKLTLAESKNEKLTNLLLSLEKDLIASEERADAYKSIAAEKIELLEKMNEKIMRESL